MNGPQRFTKKPVTIEAFAWDGNIRLDHPLTKWIRDNGGDYDYSPETPQRLRIGTLEGRMTADVGDYIIRGVKGEFYPCKPDIFADTYEEES